MQKKSASTQPALFPQANKQWSGELPKSPIGPVWVAVSTLGLARVMIGAPLETTADGQAPETLAIMLSQLKEYFQRRRERF
jgi:hypothetical protein